MPKNQKIITALLILWTLGFRLWLVFEATPQIGNSPDSKDYFSLAYSIAHGEYIQRDGKRAFRTPGFPLYLTAIHSVTGWQDTGRKTVLILNVVLETATALLIVLISGNLGFTRPWIALILWSFCIMFTPLYLTESLFTCLFALGLWLGLRKKTPEILRGLVVAVAVMVRPIGIVLLAAGKFPRKPLPILLLLLPTILFVSGWMARNYAAVGAPVFSTNLGYHNALMLSEAEKQTCAGLSEIDQDKCLTKIERGKLLSNPTLYLKRIFELFKGVTAWEVAIIGWRPGRTFEQGARLRTYRLATQPQFYWLVWLLAVIGIVRYARRLLPLLIVAGIYIALHAVVSGGSLRFVYPLIPVAAILANAAFTRKSTIATTDPPVE